jgi:cytochrome c biogenesis protein CcmG/thiol:disulfide interchange protein DsbE
MIANMNSNNNSMIFYFTLLGALILGVFIYVKTSKPPHSTQINAATLPAFNLPALYDSDVQLSQSSLVNHVYLLHFWASWCNACRNEHDMLLKIKSNFHVPIFGINYRDNPEEAKSWLTVSGNPFDLIASDTAGALGNQFQIYGTPETFIIDKKGRIRYQYVGVLNDADWQNILLPLIKQYNLER